MLVSGGVYLAQKSHLDIRTELVMWQEVSWGASTRFTFPNKESKGGECS